nr:hypothetical protein [Tanacetum cinerariifolium]
MVIRHCGLHNGLTSFTDIPTPSTLQPPPSPQPTPRHHHLHNASATSAAPSHQSRRHSIPTQPPSPGEEESFDHIHRTPKDSEDDGNGDEDQGLKISEEERIHEEEEADELYRDVNINQGRGLQVSHDVEDFHVTLTPIHPDGQQESSSVSSFVTSMLNLISDADSEDDGNGEEDQGLRVSEEQSLIEEEEADELYRDQMHEAVRVAVQIQTDRIHDSYQRENDEFLKTIDDNMKRIIKEQVKSQVKDQVLRILPRIEQSVNAQLEYEVLTRSSHSSRTSVAADLSEMELKKILIEKMEGKKSIQRSNEQRNLYKALVDAYEADKTILESYGETTILKRRREDNDDQEGPSAGSDRGSKRRREGREPESASTPSEPATRSAEDVSQKPPTTDRDWNKTLPAVQGSAQTWISELVKQADSCSSFNELLDTLIDFSNFIMNRLRPLPLIPDNRGRRVIPFAHFINNDLEYLRGGASSKKYTTSVTKTKAADYGHIKWIEDLVPRTMWIQEPINYDKHALWGVSHWGRKCAGDQPIVQTSQHPECAQTWISELAKQDDSRSSFNELLDTLIDFSNFIMNRLGVDTLTHKLLAGPTYELMRGSCNSLTKLEYDPEEVYKATTDQLDWVNPKGQQYPHNLLQPLPLILDNRDHRVILFAHFINNDLEYLRGGASSRKYTTSVTKTKAVDCGHIKWIEDLFYGFAVNRESALDVYSKRRIIVVSDLKIVEWHNYKHLDWISVRRDDDKIYKFKEGDFKRLRLQDIEDMLLLLVQGKLSNLTVEERFAFNVSLRMFTKSIVIQRRVEDLQLGVESYQKRLNLTKPDTYRFDLNDGMLNDVRNALDDRLKGIRM